MDETDFANMDDLNVRPHSSPNVYTILESQKRNEFKIPRKTHPDKYLKKSTAFLIIFLCINVAIVSCIGCGVLVYLLTNKNTECELILPSNIALSEKQVKGQKEGTPGPVQHDGRLDVSIINQGCHGYWVAHGKSCYLFSNESVTWLTAMVRCQNQGGNLASINSATEEDFLKKQIKHVKNADCYPNTSTEYRGFKQTTYDGHVCQRWDSQTPHGHTRNKAETFPEKSLAGASNYCRDPDSEGFPWCYTTDPKIRWQHCGIYSCNGGDFWIGLVTLEGHWQWMKDKPEKTNFTNWADGKPTKGMCGYLAGPLNLEWDAQSCELPAMYVCEKSRSSVKYPT